MMEPINGLKLPEITQFKKVADLIWFEGPLLSHFISPEKEDYLFYWADMDKDRCFEKWIIIQTNDYLINRYINKYISLRELMLKTLNGIAFSVEIDQNINYNNIFAFSIDSIKPNYLPEEDSFYEFEPVEYYNVSNISQKNETGIMELKISGRHINEGTMRLNQYSDAIDKVNDVINQMTNDFVENYLNSNYKSNEITQKLRNLMQENTSFDVLATAPGSFKIYLKPHTRQSQLTNDEKEVTDIFADEILNLLQSGIENNVVAFDHYDKLYKTDLIGKYFHLAKYIKDNNFNLNFIWFNAGTKHIAYNKISPTDSENIIKNIINFRTKDPQEFSVEGYFTLLNVKTGLFILNLDENNFYRGHYFSENKEPLKQIKFDRNYIVTLSVYYDKNGDEKITLQSFEII